MAEPLNRLMAPRESRVVEPNQTLFECSYTVVSRNPRNAVEPKSLVLTQGWDLSPKS